MPAFFPSEIFDARGDVLLIKGYSSLFVAKSTASRLFIYVCMVTAVALWGAPAFSEDEISAFESELVETPLEQLGNIKIVVASKEEENLRDAPGVVSVVTQDEIRRFGGTTLKDILERVPGLIGTAQYTSARSEIAIRGDQVASASAHTLLLINGRPIREILKPGIKSPALEAFPVNIIERIEVIRGPGSVLYGSNAFSGVINVVTKNAEKDEMSITSTGGPDGVYDLMGHTTLKVDDDVSLSAAIQHLQREVWHTQYLSPGLSGDTIADDVVIPNVGTGTHIDLKFHDFKAMFGYDYWKTAYFNPQRRALFDSLGNAKSQSYYSTLGYDTSLNKWWRTSLNGSYVLSKNRQNNWSYNQGESHESLAEWTNFFSLSDKTDLTAGGVFIEQAGGTKDHQTGIYAGKGHQNNVALYAQLAHKLLDNVSLIGGTQANKVENINWEVVPRAGIIWHPITPVSVKALYGEAYRAPCILETNLDSPTFVGNPDLKAETVDTFDFAIEYQDGETDVEVSLFNSRMNDLIIKETAAFPQTYTNQDGAVTLQGVEVAGKQYIGRAIFLTGSATFQESSTATETNLAPIANFGAKAGISYEMRDTFTIGLFDIFQGPLSGKFDSELNPSPGSYNKLSLNFDLKLNKLFGLKTGPQSSFVAQFNNLLDKQIWIPNWEGNPKISMPYEEGRAIYLGLNVTF